MAVILGLVLMVAIAGCGGSGHPSIPEQIAGLILDPDGTTLHGRFDCSGTLTAAETPTVVTLTWMKDYVGGGAGSCAGSPLAVHLTAPLGRRVLLDSVTQAPIVTLDLTHTPTTPAGLATPTAALQVEARDNLGTSTWCAASARPYRMTTSRRDVTVVQFADPTAGLTCGLDNIFMTPPARGDRPTAASGAQQAEISAALTDLDLTLEPFTFALTWTEHGQLVAALSDATTAAAQRDVEQFAESLR